MRPLLGRGLLRTFRSTRLALAGLGLAGAFALAGDPERSPPVHDVAERLVGAALVDDTAWRRLEHLSDRIGHRLSGSRALEVAVEWARSEMEKDGLERVRAQKVMVPHWVRGRESATLLGLGPGGADRPLAMLGLGNTEGTPPQGVEAEVVSVPSFDALEALGAEGVRGKIVLYDVPFKTYGETVAYRTTGASRAAKLGAVASLVRSVGPVSLRTPHTGVQRYTDGVTRIPAAALSIEDATTLTRLAAAGSRPRVRLFMEAHFQPDAESANVIGEIRGRERPEEVVLVGGHLDSWDVGTGSSDDGGGVVVTWEAVRLMKRLGLRPRRTVRVVLFTNEENGGRGAQAYRDGHRTDEHVLAIESDNGVTRPSGFGLAKAQPESVRAFLRPLLEPLRGIGADHLGEDGGGADIAPLMADGVPGLSLAVDTSHYFDIHHTAADTFDKIDRTNLSLCAASVAVFAHAVADAPGRPRPWR